MLSKLTLRFVTKQRSENAWANKWRCGQKSLCSLRVWNVKWFVNVATFGWLLNVKFTKQWIPNGMQKYHNKCHDKNAMALSSVFVKSYLSKTVDVSFIQQIETKELILQKFHNFENTDSFHLNILLLYSGAQYSQCVKWLFLKCDCHRFGYCFVVCKIVNIIERTRTECVELPQSTKKKKN